jgi:copper chaperone
MILIEVSGMSCPHCANTVKCALEAVPGVTRVVSVELESGLAKVEGDANAAELVAAVRQAGYEARVG